MPAKAFSFALNLNMLKSFYINLGIIMRQADINKIIEELNKKLSENFDDYKGAYFYGSRLKGNYKEDSDLDIVAIFNQSDIEKRMKIWVIIGEIEYKYNLILDLHPMTLNELKQNPYYFEEVVDNGKFYEAA